MINKTTKRLLSASRLGITFDYANGHRWINFSEDGVGDNETVNEKLQRNNIRPNIKNYGNLIDCLNFVDFLLKKINEPLLEERFGNFNDWGFDDEFVGNHTDWEESGNYNDRYFEHCFLFGIKRKLLFNSRMYGF